MASVNLGKIFDIKINLHYSWFFILILLAFSLATDYFPSEYAGFTTTTYWIFGVAAGVLLFACVLAHELSHSLVAKHHGLDVRGITLFFFGGVANADEEGLDPGKEFQIAIAGPLLSTALGGVFFLLMLIPFATTYSYPILDYLFKINLILAAFNMIPGFPLDGGRVFRSIMWKVTGSLRKATRYASNGGRIFGGLMVFAGFVMLFTIGGGLWYVLLGGFLYILAKASYEQVVLKENLSDSKVKDIMSNEFTQVEPDTSLETFIDNYVKRGYQKFVLKHKEDYYLIDFDQLKKISREQWPVKQLKDVMVKVEPSRESHDAWKAFMQMQRHGANMAPVVKKNKITGVVTIQSLMRTAQLG